MKITPEVRALAIEWAERRCECTGENCGHHLSGARCKRGLRGDDWKVFWRTEHGGTTRENLEAWCLGCFDNNYEVPREAVTLLAPALVGYERLLEEDHRRAITMRSVLRDVAERVADEHRGRLVLQRLEDDLILEFASSQDAVTAARSLQVAFLEMVKRLNLPEQELCGVIHHGEVTRWRNGVLVGDAVDVMAGMKALASIGEIVLTAAAVAPLEESVEAERVEMEESGAVRPERELWTIKLHR